MALYFVSVAESTAVIFAPSMALPLESVTVPTSDVIVASCPYKGASSNAKATAGNNRFIPTPGYYLAAGPTYVMVGNYIRGVTNCKTVL